MAYADLKGAIEASSDLVCRVRLIGRYENRLTVRVSLQSHDGPLSGSDLRAVERQIVSHVEQETGWKLYRRV